jgi:hypothetical protein
VTSVQQQQQQQQQTNKQTNNRCLNLFMKIEVDENDEKEQVT